MPARNRLKQEQTIVGNSECLRTCPLYEQTATNPDFDVVARAAVQIKNALDATIALGGENYVFWGGREGYMSLLNTDQKREKNHLALLLAKARIMPAAKVLRNIPDRTQTDGTDETPIRRRYRNGNRFS